MRSVLSSPFDATVEKYDGVLTVATQPARAACARVATPVSVESDRRSIVTCAVIPGVIDVRWERETETACTRQHAEILLHTVSASVRFSCQKRGFSRKSGPTPARGRAPLKDNICNYAENLMGAHRPPECGPISMSKS